MQFTLHYEGRLPHRSKGNSNAKANVRECLEPQLRQLWTLPPLVYTNFLDPEPGNLSAIVHKHSQSFAAAITESMKLAAELDIMILKPEPAGGLVRRGDIDNQLKVLLDALSVPLAPGQIPGSMRRTSAADPMYVLLEDDRLITRVNVESDRLLGAEDLDSVRLMIRVSTRPIAPIWANQMLA
ncbi:MAG: hypothetical protein ACJ71Z_13255 [Aeromicrobium sp.]